MLTCLLSEDLLIPVALQTGMQLRPLLHSVDIYPKYVLFIEDLKQ